MTQGLLVAMSMVVALMTGVPAVDAEASVVYASASDETSITVAWHAPAGSNNFEVYVGGQYRGSTNSSTELIGGLAPGTSYYVRVLGYTSNGSKFTIGDNHLRTQAASTANADTWPVDGDSTSDGPDAGGTDPSTTTGDGCGGCSDDNTSDGPDGGGTDPGTITPSGGTSGSADWNGGRTKSHPYDYPNFDPTIPTPPVGPWEALACHLGCITVGVIIGSVSGGPAGSVIGGVCSSTCPTVGHKGGLVVKMDAKAHSWATDKAKINRRIAAELKKGGQSPRQIQSVLRAAGTTILGFIPPECVTSKGSLRRNHKDCARASEIYLAGRDLSSWKVDDHQGDYGGNGWAVDSPRPDGNFRCRANGYRYYSNGTTAYRQHGDDGYTPCPGVVFDFHVYKDGSVVQVISGSGGSGDSGWIPTGNFKCPSNGMRYYSNGRNAYLHHTHDTPVQCPDVSKTLRFDGNEG